MKKQPADLAPFAPTHRRARTIQTAVTAVSFAGAALLTGCGAGRQLPVVSAAASSAAMHGNVHGGQQPVSGAQIQLWAAGNSSNQSAATPLLTSAVYTDAGGGFGISGDYTCPSSSTQVYLTATGGNPGLSAPANNGALALVAPLGDCGSLSTVPMISVNELTTVAAAYALAPFASGVGQVGASSGNLAGLRSAMQTAMMLTSPYSGQAPGALPTGASTETAKLVTLANVISSCVNSSGGAECSTLGNDVSVSGYGTPSDTFQMALMVAQHPGNNVAAVFNDAPAHAAYGGSLPNAPSDWTMSIAYTGGGLAHPNGLNVDSLGNVWVTNYAAGLSAFTPQGTAIFSGGITNGVGLPSAAAVDGSGYLWVANGAYDLAHSSGSMGRVAPDGTVVSGSAGYTQGGINLPSAVAAAPNGTMIIADAGSSMVTIISATGQVVSGPGGYGAGVLSTPSAIAVDAQSNVWIANRGSGNLVEMDPSGNMLLQSSCCNTPDSIQIDSNGNLWVGDRSSGTVTEVRSDGLVMQTINSSSSFAPSSLAIDGGSHLFVADAAQGALRELFDSSYAAAGTSVGQTAQLGLDAGLQNPLGVITDASGNVWVTSATDNRLVSFVGLAVPARTPRAGLPTQP